MGEWVCRLGGWTGSGGLVACLLARVGVGYLRSCGMLWSLLGVVFVFSRKVDSLGSLDRKSVV